MGPMSSTLFRSLCIVPGPNFLAAVSHSFPFLSQLCKDNLKLFSTSLRYVLLWNIVSIFCLGTSDLANLCSHCVHLISFFPQISGCKLDIFIFPQHLNNFFISHWLSWWSNKSSKFIWLLRSTCIVPKRLNWRKD